MKKHIVIISAFGLLMGTGCKKTTSASYTCSASAPNKITVQDGGSTYNACGSDIYPLGVSLDGVQVVVGTNAYPPAPYPEVELFAGQDNIFSLNIDDTVTTPITGVGVYTLMPVGTTMAYVEHFAGGESYTVSGGIINFTHLDSINVAGTFTINVFNTSGSKTLTGTFNADQPMVF